MNIARQIDRHAAAIVAALAEGGFKAHLNDDPKAYADYVGTVPGYSLTSPLDLAFVDVREKFIWLRVTDSAGNLVAIEAGRYLKAPTLTGGLNRLLKSRRFFGEHRPTLPVVTTLPAINLSGDLGYMGGGFVAKEHRDRGVMSLTAQLTMLHLMRLFPIDHLFGLVKAQHVARSLRLQGYGFTSATAVRWAYWADSAAPETLFMVHVDRAALIDRVDEQPHYALKKSTIVEGKV
ncbi:hypothetical protein [Ferrovibrio terrae]|uniref:hypothetical protein n=1 Tax=Ferrovibrio terrae TaxID=2594003 RepID=UPI003137C9AF